MKPRTTTEKAVITTIEAALEIVAECATKDEALVRLSAWLLDWQERGLNG